MADISATDLSFLHRTIELARAGGVAVRPNPNVGALLAVDDQLIAEGFHRALGAPHAEVEAIRAAGDRDLSPATLYVSLEPCAHEGRTPPCTDAIIKAGIRRVVVASDDPSEHANGRGLGIMRDEGIEVLVADGDVARAARLLNQPFRKLAKTGRPWVLFKAAMSLDGKVATRGGDSRWISGEPARELTHRWRSECDAVAVGIGTALADDPQLTARVGGSDSKQLATRQPRRILFDSEGRVPVHSRLIAAAGETPLTVVVSRAAPRTVRSALTAHGVELIVVSGENEPARVASALTELGESGISTVLLEGGPKLAGAFLDAGEIDELRLFVAPIIIGGHGARDPIESAGVEHINEAIRTLSLEHQQIGDDLLITARVHEW